MKAVFKNGQEVETMVYGKGIVVGWVGGGRLVRVQFKKDVRDFLPGLLQDLNVHGKR